MTLWFPYLLFDLDGTLVDSEPGIVSTFSATLQHYGLTASDEAIAGQIGPPLGDMFTTFGLDPALHTEAIAHYREIYAAGAMYEGSVYEGALETIAALHQSGHRMAVTTSKSDRYAGEVVRHFGFGDYFETVTGANESLALTHKPELIAESLRRLSAEPADAVMFGDRDVDLIGATANGVQSIGVLWGYGSEAELIKARPMAIARAWAEVPALVSGRRLGAELD